MTTRKSFSFFRGYSFSFKTEGCYIEAWFSSFSGLEKVFVNGVLVSSQRNFSKDSTSAFKIGENEYSTTLQVKNLLKGPFVCTLSKNGTAFKRQRLVFPQENNQSRKVPYLFQFLLFILLGIVFSVSKSFFDLPEASNYIFLSILFLLVFVYQYKFRKNKNAKPLIEDEEIV